MNKKFFKDNFIFLASTVIGGVLGYLFHFAVSRKLSVAEYGELQTISTLTVFFGVFSSALAFFIIKYSSVLARKNDQSGQVHFLSFLFKKFRRKVLGIFFLYLLFVPLLKNVLHLSGYSGLVAVGLSIVIFVFSAFYLNALQGWKKFFALGVTGVATSAVKLVAGFSFASFAPTASSVSFSILVSAVFSWLLAGFFSNRLWPMKSSKERSSNWRETHFSGESFKKSFFDIFFFSLALAAASNLDILLVKNLTDAQTAGFFAALGVLGKIVMWLNLSVIGVLLPEAFSMGYGGRHVSGKTILASYMLILAITVPVLLVYYFFSGLMIQLLFGQKYVIVSGYLWLAGLSAFFLSVLFLEAKMAMARKDFRATLFLAGTVCLLAAAIFFNHGNLGQIIFSVLISFAIGWIFVLGLNLRHRFSSQISTPDEAGAE